MLLAAVALQKESRFPGALLASRARQVLSFIENACSARRFERDTSRCS